MEPPGVGGNGSGSPWGAAVRFDLLLRDLPKITDWWNAKNDFNGLSADNLIRSSFNFLENKELKTIWLAEDLSTTYEVSAFSH